MGYIVMSANLPKNGASPKFFAPLSYGRNGEPSPEQLLRRGRATLFESQDEAIKAVNATLKRAKDEGALWPKKYAIYLCVCETPDATGSEVLS